MKYDVFISYSSKDQKVVEGICGYLEGQGIRCFVAFRDIPKGKVWASAIVEGLDASSMMLIAFSESFNRSAQVDREIELAAEDKKPILTFRLSDADFIGAKKYYLKNLNWIDAFPKPEDCFGELHKNICSLLNLDNSGRADDGVESSGLERRPDRDVADDRLGDVHGNGGERGHATMTEGAEIHVDTDLECRVLQFNREVAVAHPGEDTVIRLKKGRHKLDFVSTECADDRLQMVYAVEDVDSVDMISVELLPLCEKREAEERKKREEEEQHRREAEEAARRQRETEEQRKREEEKRSSREACLLQLPDDRFKCIENNGKHGFSDRKTGESLIPCVYDDAGSFREGLARVEKDGKWGYVDKAGNEVIPLIYDFSYSFSEGLAYVKEDGGSVFIDRTGTTVIPLIYDYADSFREGLARVRNYGKWGYIDKAGKEVIPLIYDYADDFGEGLAAVSKDGKWGFVDKAGNTEIPLIYDGARSYNDGLAKVWKNWRYGYIDKSGTAVIPLIYVYAYDFSEGLAAVEKNGKRGYVDQMGKIVIPLIYDDAESFSDGLARVKKGNKWGYIDKTGEWVKDA